MDGMRKEVFTNSLASIFMALVLGALAGSAWSEESIEGTYDTNFGNLTIKVQGNKLTGSYPHDAGKLEGTIEDNKVVGRWSEAPTYKPPHDGGDFEFLFPPDKKSFAGRWRYGFGGKEWSGDWHGSRVLADAIERITGDWDTSQGKMSLKQTGNKIEGSYAGKDKKGKIDGIVQGNIIKGGWSQAPSFKPPTDAGEFMFVLSEDRKSFAGKFRTGFGGSAWSGNWTGSKMSASGYQMVDGVYDTFYGKLTFKLTIKQSGNKITGNYGHDDGKIEGTVEGREIRGRWMESPTYKPPKDAGLFRFVFSEDLKSFTGKWHYGFEEGDWRADWSGKKVQ
jgi:hypothetical protein